MEGEGWLEPLRWRNCFAHGSQMPCVVVCDSPLQGHVSMPRRDRHHAQVRSAVVFFAAMNTGSLRGGGSDHQRVIPARAGPGAEGDRAGARRVNPVRRGISAGSGVQERPPPAIRTATAGSFPTIMRGGPPGTLRIRGKRYRIRFIRPSRSPASPACQPDGAGAKYPGWPQVSQFGTDLTRVDVRNRLRSSLFGAKADQLFSESDSCGAGDRSDPACSQANEDPAGAGSSLRPIED
jgi:hypothetical protein